MILKNLTKNSIITRDLKVVESFTDQLLGLIKKSNPRSLFFKSRFGIHTFFLREPIDVVILDRGYKTVKIKEGLKPNRVFFWNPKYFYILELPKQALNNSQTSAGDILEII